MEGIVIDRVIMILGDTEVDGILLTSPLCREFIEVPNMDTTLEDMGNTTTEQYIGIVGELGSITAYYVLREAIDNGLPITIDGVGDNIPTISGGDGD